jgi:Outer membrane protein beta-barrel domain
MKKAFLSFCFAGGALVTSAQVQYGVKAGYNLANLNESGSSTENLKSLSSFNGGLFVAFPMKKSCFVQAEAVYSGQGSKEELLGKTSKLNLGYLNVPVLFKYEHHAGLFAETGPQLGFLLTSKVKAENETIDVKDQFHTIDFSWAFGLGYQFTSIGLGIDARYNLGLDNIANSGGSESIKNSVFQFGLFYSFVK